MKWNEALDQEMIAPKSICQLIIIGETKDGQPFCLEESFLIQKISKTEFTVILEFPCINPLEKLDHVSFIECSFRDRGILFHAFSQLIQVEIKKTFCLLTLAAPEEIQQHQNRHYTRMNLQSRTPITARIVGIRGQATHQGIAFTGQLLDISGGGLSFITPYRLFYPLFLELSFVLPNYPEKFTIYGEIIRVSNFSNDYYRIAITFSKTMDAILHQIDEYCTHSS